MAELSANELNSIAEFIAGLNDIYGNTGVTISYDYLRINDKVAGKLVWNHKAEEFFLSDAE